MEIPGVAVQEVTQTNEEKIPEAVVEAKDDEAVPPSTDAAPESPPEVPLVEAKEEVEAAQVDGQDSPADDQKVEPDPPPAEEASVPSEVSSPFHHDVQEQLEYIVKIGTLLEEILLHLSHLTIDHRFEHH